MWKRENFVTHEIETWYSTEEFKELEDKLVKCEEILYNIEKHLKERHDWIAIQKIEEEVEKWKKNLNAKSAEISTEMP